MAILITDDSRVVRLGLARLIAVFYDGEVLLADSGEEAIRILAGRTREDGEEVDLLLIDQVMEGMSGAQTCLALRSKDRWLDLPIIVMTASHDDEVLEDAFRSGANDFILKPPNKVELRARISSLLQLKREMNARKEKERHLEQAQEKLQRLVLHLEQISIRDPLTGIANRRQFDDRLALEWRRTRRNRQPLGILMIDIDFFKKFNDRYGHLEGDRCLCKVALALHNSVHRAGDLCARYGGEEFVILMPDTGIEGAEKVARRCVAKVAAEQIAHEDEPNGIVTVSIGVATVIPENDEKLALLERADDALYVAKESGRNRYWISPDSASAE